MPRPTLAAAVAVLLLAHGPALAAQGAPAEPETRTLNDGNLVLSGMPELPDGLTERLEPYQNVRSAGLADWSERGASIFVTTRFGDVPQIHRVDAPGGARHQITFYEEPVGGVRRRPGSEELLFGMDEGGSEFVQLYLLGPGASTARRLTDGSSRNGSAVFSDDGRLLAFSSTRRDGRHNDIWLMPVEDTAAARLLVEAPDGSFWGAADWSADGARLLVIQYVSVADSRLYVVDIATGERRLLAGDPENPVAVAGVGGTFDAGGGGVFYASDEGSEFRRLRHLDLESGEERVIGEGIPWDVQGFSLSEDGARAAFSVNEGGVSRPYLLDPRSFEYRPVEGIPTGLVGGGRFSPDGGRLALTLNTPKTPSDVFVLELGAGPLDAGALERWTFSEVGGLDSGSFIEPELIAYASFDGMEIPAFVYRPPGPGPHPVVISIHGGPEGQYRPAFSSAYQSWIGELGAALIAPNVRGSSGYGKTYLTLDNARLRENSVRDIGALLDWIATQPDLDEDRVMVFGGSYGGYMVLASLVHFGDRLRGGVDIVGISDFVTFLENTEDYRRDLRRVEYGDERDPEMREFLTSISPATHADRIVTPLFVAQGQNDPRVPVTESEQIVRRLRENGRDVWYMNALNEGHGYGKKENGDALRDYTALFFREHLLRTAEVSRR